MKYKVRYSCVSHIGKCRAINQDNFICNGRYLHNREVDFGTISTTGILSNGQSGVLGVFDGMGGEECGEIASFLAAEEASKMVCTDDSIKDLLEFCKRANEKIVQYAKENVIGSMGTTAAILEFNDKKIGLCNIGDSKIFHFSDKKMQQISVDHVAVAAYGMKPPLSQNLGISPTDMIIEPYVAQGRYNNGDIYLICSDGLTDMLSSDKIKEILLKTEFETATEKLLEAALTNGGKDNITIILCKIQRERGNLFSCLPKFVNREKRN